VCACILSTPPLKRTAIQVITGHHRVSTEKVFTKKVFTKKVFTKKVFTKKVFTDVLEQ